MPILDPLSFAIDTSAVGQPSPSVIRPRRRLLQPTSIPGEFILELDYSSLADFLRCKRQGEYKKVYARLGLRSSAATNWGSCFHLAEEVRLRFGHSSETFARQREIVSKFFVDNPVPADEYRTSARMFDTLDRYNSLYQHDQWPKMVWQHEGEPMIERPYRIPFCTIEINSVLPYHQRTLVVGADDEGPHGIQCKRLHIVLTGKIDAILSIDSQPWVVDHKTTSRGGSEFIDYFKLSLQTRGYVWVAHQLGVPALGLQLNAVICRPLTRTGTGTEFHRQQYHYSPDLLTSYELSLRAHIEDFVHCLVTGYFPETSLSFISPCVKCDYSLTCQLPLNQRLTDLHSGVYQDNTWDPLDE